MGLISLLIALAAERKLTQPIWQFNFAFAHYMKFAKKQDMHNKVSGTLLPIVLLAVPVTLTYLLLSIIDDTILHFLVSTAILIVCFGCVKTRDRFRQYLRSAFRGEMTTCDLHYQQLIDDKNLPPLGFGQTLIWLNYRYYIAIMLFFIAFGAAGALFYRLLATLDEQQLLLKKREPDSVAITDVYQRILFWADWLPVRITSFGFMLVGHFSKAIPLWIENVFDINKAPQCVLVEVAQKAEDVMVDKNDCTSEPCLLVRLAKRNLLLVLTTVSVLTLAGVLY